MFSTSYIKRTITDFLGSWSAREETDIPSNRAALAQNVQYAEGRVLTRCGYAPTFTPADVVGSMFNWLYSDPSAGEKNYLLWFANAPSAKLRYASVASPTPTDVYAESGAYAATFANAGSRVITSQFGADGLGRGHGRCVFFNGGTLTADNLFARPMLTTEATIAGSPAFGGLGTPGSRKVAFILETRTGFVGRYGPASNDANLTVQPLTLTFTASNKQATVTVTPTGTWPAHAKSVRLVSTVASNQSRYYFVPGASATVTPGTSTAASLTFNISDSDLALTANDASAYQFLLTQSNANAAPISPVAAFEAGNRIGYIVNDAKYGQCVFFSDENNYQALNAAFSVYYLPGQRQITAAFSIGGVHYLLGPNWTYAVQDSGGFPSNWAGARKVDDAIGTVTPFGVWVNVATSTAWVASKAGLYRFMGGKYDNLPVSWRNAEYGRINWAAGNTVQIVDDAANKRVHMLVPLDTATLPDTILTWDYTNGTSADKVSFSHDYITNGGAHTAICIVQNATTKKLETWLGPGATTQYFRREKRSPEAAPYHDDESTGILSLYRTGPVLGTNRPRLSHFHGGTFRVRGAGSVSVSAKALDNVTTFNASAITAASSPGTEEDRAIDIIAEDIKWEITNGGVSDAYFDISGMTTYSSPYTTQR